MKKNCTRSPFKKKNMTKIVVLDVDRRAHGSN